MKKLKSFKEGLKNYLTWFSTSPRRNSQQRKYNNVECKRCGNRWYSEEFDKENKLPEKCPYCYKDSVREIPGPPSRSEVFKKRLREKRQELSELKSQKLHQMILWKEQNRFLINLMVVAFFMLLIIAGIIYMLFFG